MGILEKERETSWDNGVCLCAIRILACRDKPTSHRVTNIYTHGNNSIPISVVRRRPPTVQRGCR